MVAELDTEAETGDQVDHKHSIHLNGVRAEDFIEHPHGSHELEEHEEHTASNDDCNA